MTKQIIKNIDRTIKKMEHDEIALIKLLLERFVMIILSYVLIAFGILYDFCELVVHFIQALLKRRVGSATPLFGFLVSMSGVIILRFMNKLSVGETLLFGFILLLLNLSMQTLFPVLLRVPLNLLNGRYYSLFQPISYKCNETDSDKETKSFDRIARRHKRKNVTR